MTSSCLSLDQRANRNTDFVNNNPAPPHAMPRVGTKESTMRSEAEYLRRKAMETIFADPNARDMICDLCELVKDMADEIATLREMIRTGNEPLQ